MRKICSIFLCICLLAFSAVPSVLAFGGGDGTEKNPYQVATLEDLKEVAKDLTAYYIQTADITITDEDATVSGNKVAVISGTFTGHYNGNGRTITFDNITEATFGFSVFKIIGAGGVVENLKTAGSIAATGNSIAAITYSNSGTIKNCVNSADITSTFEPTTKAPLVNVGGIAAVTQRDSLIENCRNSGNISGATNIGGIVGSLGFQGATNSSSIKNCISTGNITATGNYAGGIVGGMSNTVAGTADILNCSASGNVSAASHCGGIMSSVNRDLNGTLNITNCSFLGTVTTTVDYNGGIFGSIAYTLTDGTIKITKCYVSGAVNANSNVGGIAGCFATSNTTKTTVNVIGNYFTGTITGTATGSRVGAIVGTPFVNGKTGTISVSISRNYSTAPGTQLVGYNSTNTTTANWSIASDTNLILSDGVTTARWGTNIDENDLKDPETFYAKDSTGVLSNYFVYDIGDRTDKYPYPQFASNPHNAPGTVLASVTFTCGENGTLSKQNGYVTSGDTVSVKIQPNEGYVISEVLFNEAPAVIQNAAGFTYQTSPITAASAISAAFQEIVEEQPSIAHTYTEKFTSSGSQIINGTEIAGPMSIVFAKVLDFTGYTLQDFGMEFAVDAATLTAGNGKKCSATAGKSSLGNYGICFYGSFTKGQTYYTRPYAIYVKDGEEPLIVTGQILDIVPNP